VASLLRHRLPPSLQAPDQSGVVLGSCRDALGRCSAPGREPCAIALALAGETGKGTALVTQLGPALPTVVLETLPEPVRVVRGGELGRQGSRLLGCKRQSPGPGSVQAFGRELALWPAQKAGEQAAWIVHPALLPLLPDMRHGLHDGACAMPIDGLVEVTGGKPEPVGLLASLDLAFGRLVQAGTVLVGLFVLVRPCSLESVRLINLD
jgi:hypothetical protein